MTSIYKSNKYELCLQKIVQFSSMKINDIYFIDGQETFGNFNKIYLLAGTSANKH